ncbi:MAG TPA: exodeoxyribonuclease VII small subunit [Anaerolineales bacterium]|jgi:exodeoxyribonuclease VII small subunit
MAKAKPKPKPKPVEELAYEQAFDELEQIVEALESGDLTLEQSLERFARGQGLARRCSELLEQAELKLNQLTPTGDGDYAEMPFEEGA